MTLEEKIQNYFAMRRINLNKDHVKYLIKVVLDHKEDMRTVNKYFYTSGKYELIKTIRVPYIVVSAKLQDTSIKQIQGYYQYELFDNNGKPTGSIFSANASLFD